MREQEASPFHDDICSLLHDCDIYGATQGEQIHDTSHAIYLHSFGTVLYICQPEEKNCNDDRNCMYWSIFIASNCSVGLPLLKL